MVLNCVPVKTKAIHVGVGRSCARLWGLRVEATRIAHDISVTSSAVLVVVNRFRRHVPVRLDISGRASHLAHRNVFCIRIVAKGVTSVVKADIGVSAGAVVGLSLIHI